MVLVFDLILALVALAALCQLAKVIFYTCCWLGCQLFLLLLWSGGDLRACVVGDREAGIAPSADQRDPLPSPPAYVKSPCAKRQGR